MNLLLDSDFLIALANKEDASHDKAIILFQKIYKETLHVLNIVSQESTTVVSKRFGMIRAKLFYTRLNELVNKLIILDSNIESLAWKLFLAQTKKGTSFVDCANLATLNYYKLDGILSFDEFYKEKRIKG
ncbi:type II toxin-antitoxin system VapC family toxin [Candidatus Gottesmanbacteria bacterium]|nr:type II toxin-antitoxin system VapC family toxin [Candidatus Gottesmanbacteria bacterium]MBI5452283.1 type II toxin-antitoxin system VapC family toxin [Candidatus Gottesmanbacteria bacterium]